MPAIPALLGDTSVGYYFRTDISGRPGSLHLRQHRGHMHFDWHDYSSCEQAFSISREAALNSETMNGVRPTPLKWNAAEAFDDDHYVQGTATCGEHIAPAQHTDDLTGEVAGGTTRPVGLWQRSV